MNGRSPYTAKFSGFYIPTRRRHKKQPTFPSGFRRSCYEHLRTDYLLFLSKSIKRPAPFLFPIIRPSIGEHQQQNRVAIRKRSHAHLCFRLRSSKIPAMLSFAHVIREST